MKKRKQPVRFGEGGHAEEHEGWKTQDKLIDAAIFGAGLLTPRGAIKKGIGKLGKSVSHWADDAAETGGKRAARAAKDTAEEGGKSAVSAGRLAAGKAFGENAARHEGRTEARALSNKSLKGGNRTFERDEEPETDRKFSIKDKPRKVGRTDTSDDSDDAPGSRKALGYSRTPSVIEMGTEPDSTWKEPGVVRTTDTAAEAIREARRKKSARTKAANKAKREADKKRDDDDLDDDLSGGMGMSGKRGGLIKRSSASSRGDGIAKRGRTRGINV